MKIFPTIAKVILTILIPVILFLVYSSYNDYKPEKKELVYNSITSDCISDSTDISFLIWNLGFGGLNAEMDFFYDGGNNVRPNKATSEKNLDAILSFLRKESNIDFILLQEVDEHSKRSYYVNQVDTISQLLAGHVDFFGKNFDVSFIPIPLFDPVGEVTSGILSLSMFHPLICERYSFPGNYNWPLKLFMLDRCFLVNRYNVENGHELVVINTHNSAYDDGSLRKKQMDYLQGFLLGEYAKGNYVIVGGDWNQCPPGLTPEFKAHKFDTENLSFIPTDYISDSWKWVFDSSRPTHRRLLMPYEKGITPTTLIDFYLVSPNVKVEKVETIDLGFENSDHQPVKAIFKLM